ncbi:MAG: ABC transporter substrate-binding protein [Anaerolineae bacterium]|nr:ABC transporter substrate-binding protein [Anaerolineae bacterium]
MRSVFTVLIVAALLALATPLAAQEGKEAIGSLSIALLPVIDTLPFYVAEANGYFEEVGVEVGAVPVSSPVERDQIMQAGAIDGMLNELTTTATFNRDAGADTGPHRRAHRL